MRAVFLFFYLFLTVAIAAQEDSVKSKFDWLELSGFISHSVKYDTRQSVTAREGEIYLYPKPIELDKYGQDKNDFGRLQMFNFHSRMKWKVKGPKLGSFKTSGTLEFDFVGTTNELSAIARLRHAFVSISGDKLDILVGQYWHPTFITECYPEIVAWGAAIPLQPFNRSPQIRLTYKPGPNLSIAAAAVSQRDFANSGPNGSSGDYLRNSGLPELQLQFISKLGDHFMFGATGGYKTIVPRLTTDSLIAHKETISSYNVSAFAKIKTDNFFLKLHGIYGQNLNNLLLLGGYMVDEVSDVNNDYRTYKNLSVFALWSEIEYKINNWGLAFFGGVVNAPDNKDAIGNANVYGLGTNISSLYKWEPRITYQKSKLMFGLELAATTAEYLEHQVNGITIPANSATNYRIIFLTMLKF